MTASLFLEKSAAADTDTKAIIYCRVSSKKQKETGSGLVSQEHRCREYAERHGWDVEAVFPDDISGAGDFMKRPGMKALLSYLDAQSDKDYVVIFDDLKRFARDTEFHIKLRRELKVRNAKVECLNFRFEDTPEGKFIETVFAAHGELEREQNGRQVKQKMRARVEQGFWVFNAPVGYKYAKATQGGKILVRDEPLASIVQEALEAFACGRFQSQVEVQRFLERQPLFPKDLPNNRIRAYKISRMLTTPVYAGYVHATSWNIDVREGRHEGLISYATFEKIQERLQQRSLAPARKDIRSDFVLRGFVECGTCGTALTSCWSQSKTGRKHPYYRCYNKSCSDYAKSIRRDQMEGEFETIVRSLQPTPVVFEIVASMFRDAWDQRMQQTKDGLKLVRQEVLKIEKQIDHLLERIVDTSSQTVIKAYESKIAKLEREKLITKQNMQNRKAVKHTYDDLFELAMEFLSKPWILWTSGNFYYRKMLLRMAFTERLAYSRKDGFLNPKKALPFNILEGIRDPKSKMVLPERFELSASPLPRSGPIIYPSFQQSLLINIFSLFSYI
jgi:site-specific DNA recombinase